MIRDVVGSVSEASRDEWPTVWGLRPAELHDYYWASRSVQVVRPGDGASAAQNARLFLLSDSRSLTLFRLGRLANMLAWMKPRVLLVRIRNERQQGPREITVTDERLQLQRFQRLYDRPDAPAAEVLLTTDRRVAELWGGAPDEVAAREELEARVSASGRASTTITGRVWSAESRHEVGAFVRELVGVWKRPDITVGRTRRLEGEVWADEETRIGDDVRFVGPIWIGAGRRLPDREGVVGPTVLWDDPRARPRAPSIRWDRVRRDSATESLMLHEKPKPRGYPGKRCMDLTAAVVLLALTLPLYPFIMLLIWLQDGRPFFFAHRRQTFGGREFPCVKFRTMRRDAEEVKARLMRENQADGPQFYLKEDPRLLRIGKFLRRTNLDELPQLINVLLGQMSLVGPRPSPFEENQYCPEWRNARLSVRPGITGLWQVKRTRQDGLDFQEWIKYDIEYVERVSWGLDLWILWRTARVLLRF